jgi:hypothetical protein
MVDATDLCRHYEGRQSGQLAVDHDTGLYSAWMVCELCGASVRYMPRQSADANELAQRQAASAAAQQAVRA